LGKAGCCPSSEAGVLIKQASVLSSISLTEPLTEPPSRAAEYRRLAAECLEVAERMSLREDRARMMEMAQRWLDLAQKAEGELGTNG
jgi:hypothetical protein